MKRSGQKGLIQKQIKIPIQFTKKLDKISLLDLQEYNHIQKKQIVPIKSQMSLQMNRQLTSSHSLQSFRRNTTVFNYLTTEKDSLSRQKKSSKIRFRTTGAGFRQRVIPQIQEYNSQKKKAIFQRSPAKPRTVAMTSNKQVEKYQLKQFIVKKQVYQQKKSKQITKTVLPKRIYFGQKYEFNQKGEYEYNQKFQLGDIDWGQQISSYRNFGFGVDKNLSFYDLASLDDPDGSLFMLQHAHAQAICPVFSNGQYNWAKIQIVDFDHKTNQVVIKRTVFNDLKKVSRLSIQFEKQNTSQQYWQRINKAKKLRKIVKQQQKYIRYLQSRKQTFNLQQLIKGQFKPHLRNMIEKQWLTLYSRQIIIYKEMDLKPQKYQEMGIRIRKFQPFSQPPITNSFEQFSNNRQLLSSKHYSKFQKFPDTLFKLYERLTEQSCSAINLTLPSMTIGQLMKLQCQCVQKAISALINRTRQLLLSDIFGRLAFSFKNKSQQKRYFRLHNLIFNDLIRSNLYEYNIGLWLSYLQTFTGWTTSTPHPIINLILTIDSNSKTINMIPNEQTVKLSLLHPLIVLEKGVESIPDILSELNGGEPTRIKIKFSLLERSRKVIAHATQFSYRPVKQFCLKLSGKLVYLQKIKLQKQLFSDEGRNKYQIKFRKMQQDLKDVAYSVIYRTGFLSIDAKQAKQILSIAITNQKNKLGKLIEKQIEEEVQKMTNQFHQKKQQLKVIPTDQLHLVNMRLFLNQHCQRFIDFAIVHYNTSLLFYDLLQNHIYLFAKQMYERSTEMIALHTELMKLITSKLRQLNDIEQQMIQKINSEREAIMKGLEEVGSKIDVVKRFPSLAAFSQNYIFTSKNYLGLEGYQKQLDNINYRQKLLDQQISIFPLLTKLQKQLKPYYDMWNIAYHLLRYVQSIKSDPIHTIKYEDLNSHLTEYSKQLNRLLGYFVSVKNSEAFNVTETLIQKLTYALDKLWIIRSFTLQGMIKKDGIRKEVLNTIFKGKQVNFQELTLQTLMKQNIEQQKLFVISSAQKAERIWKLQQRIFGIVNETKLLQFQFAAKYSIPFVDQKILLALSCAVHQQVEIMESIKDLDEASYIQKKINNVYHRLTTIEETIQHMNIFQSNFFPVYQLTRFDQIARDMNKEMTTLLEVERVWKTICNQFMKDSQLWECIDSDSYKNRMEHILKLLGQVDKRLSQVLDSKRQEFPRLFFISRQDFKDLMIHDQKANSSNFMPFFFSGIRDFIMNEDKIRGVIGIQKQQIHFKRNLPRKLIWQYLGYVLAQMSKIVLWQINVVSNPIPKGAFGKGIRILCKWTNLLQQSIVQNSMHKLALKIAAEIEQIYSSCSTQSYYLCSLLLYFRDRIAHLLANNVSQLYNFQWRKELKYFKTQGGGVQLKTLNLSMQFKDQYTGNQIKPIFLLSDRSTIQILLCAWNMNNGMILEGLGSQTIRQLCGFTLRHFAEFSVGANTNYQQITFLLKGYLLSETWMNLALDTPFKPQIFQLIVQTAYQVHSVIESGRTLFYLGANNFNLSKSFKFNLSISRQYQLRQEIVTLQNLQTFKYEQRSYKFGFVFRSVSWCSPPESRLIKIKMQALGLSEDIIKIVLKCYQYYQLKLQKQWFNRNFMSAVDSFTKTYLNIKQRDNANILQIFSKLLTLKLNQNQTKAIQLFFPILQTKIQKDAQSTLSQLVDQVQQGFHHKKRILVIGPHLSGKTMLIQSIFKLKNKIIQTIFKYNPGNYQTWQLIETPLFNHVIPHAQKLIMKANQTSHFSSTDASDFIIYYHNSTLNWEQVVSSKFKQIAVNESVKIQIQRQLFVLFQFPEFQNIQNNRKISFIMSFINLINILALQNKIQNFTLSQLTQFVFQLIYWQNMAFFPSVIITPNNFGSTCSKQPLNYYFDTDKMAWLEWATIHNMNFTLNASDLQTLFIPLKQSVSFIYFLKIAAYKSNIWIQSEKNGMGLNSMIERTIKWGMHEPHRVHKNSNHQSISRLISFNTKIFKKDGKYYPKMNEHLTVSVEDVSLQTSATFKNYLHILCCQSYDMLSYRQLAKVKFICTSSDAFMNQNLFLTLSKSLIRLRALNPCDQSKQTLFNYYLSWFFGNTDNPFSKQVRNASTLIVKLTVFLMKNMEQRNNKFSALSHVVKVYHSLTQCSPRTVKTTHDILDLWFSEWQNTFHDGQFQQRDQLVQSIVEFIQNQKKQYSQKIIEDLQQIISQQKSIFVKLPSLKLQYSEFYRKVDPSTLEKYLLELINQIDTQPFTSLPFIIHNNFIKLITKIVGVYGVPGKHPLLYGAREGVKKVIFQMASLICWNTRPDVIQFKQGWQKDVMTNLKPLIKQMKHKALIFKFQQNEDEQFVSVVEDLIYLKHPRSFLFDLSLKYLEEIGLSSTLAKQYEDMKRNISKCIHCCVTIPCASWKSLHQMYPALIRKMELISVMENKGQLKDIALVSTGSFFQKTDELVKVLNSLEEDGVIITKARYIKIMQLIIYYYHSSLSNIGSDENKLDEAIGKIRVVEQQKEQLEKDLANLNAKLTSITQKVQILKENYKQTDNQYQSKVKDFNEHHQECEKERDKTAQIRKQVDFQFNKVFPMLKAAQQAMAKVTRDDINQLRSFPNPPLPAAKVVQSLIFLFNQAKQVKQKVLQSGQKVRDFWQYAKKFILNDKLLKRVEQFKPEVIKDIDTGVIATLRQIIKKPEFIQQRVFKASSAAGNLSLWIKAILAVYEVMKIMEPKKKVLSDAEQALQERQQRLQTERHQLQQFHQILMEKKKKYEDKVCQRQIVIQNIGKLEESIQGGLQLLKVLHVRQSSWQIIKSKDLKQKRVACKAQAIYMAIFFQIIISLQEQKKQTILCKMNGLLKTEGYGYKQLINNINFQFYRKMLCELQQLKQTINVPITSNFCEGLIAIFQKIKLKQKVILIVDSTYLMAPFMCSPTILSKFNYSVNYIDCLQIDNFDQLAKQKDKESQVDEDAAININSNILMLTRIEHRPNLISQLPKILQNHSEQQIVIIVNQSTPEWNHFILTTHRTVDVRIQVNKDVYNFFIKQEFNLPILQTHQLSKSVEDKKIKDRIFQILCEEPNLILNKSALSEWMSLNMQQHKNQKQGGNLKQLGEVEEETINTVIELFDRQQNITISTFISLIKEHSNNQQHNLQPATLWNLVKYLTQRLALYPNSIIKIIQPKNNINPLSFYFMKYPNIEEIEKSKNNVPTKPAEGIYSSILNMKCQIVNPASVINILRKNLNAYICLTDKAKLKTALQECRKIQQMYLNQALQDTSKKQEKGHIYILSESGCFVVPEISSLQAIHIQQVITHKDWKDPPQMFLQAYQMQRFYRHFASILPKEKEYIISKLYNIFIPKIHIQEQLYLNLARIKDEAEQQEKVIVGVVKSTSQKAINMFGISFSLQMKKEGPKLQIWQIQDQLYKLYNDC